MQFNLTTRSENVVDRYLVVNGVNIIPPGETIRERFFTYTYDGLRLSRVQELLRGTAIFWPENEWRYDYACQSDHKQAIFSTYISLFVSLSGR